ncbi:MAG: hypothetical protein LBP41_03225 [Holosporaceae bacterium]|nr:hypothetical protein [Holosporaceae bacterium]
MSRLFRINNFPSISYNAVDELRKGSPEANDYERVRKLATVVNAVVHKLISIMQDVKTRTDYGLEIEESEYENAVNCIRILRCASQIIGGDLFSRDGVLDLNDYMTVDYESSLCTLPHAVKEVNFVGYAVDALFESLRKVNTVEKFKDFFARID